MNLRRSHSLLLACVLTAVGIDRVAAAEPSPSLADVISQVQPKLVKIYGAGGNDIRE